MNAQLREIADALGTIARETSAGQTAAALCSSFAENTQNALIVAATAGRGELAGRVLDSRIAVTTFAGLARNPSEAFAARVLIAAFDCSELIAASDLEIVNQLILTRPAGTYGFMFLGSDRIADPEDRDRLERSAWRLLVPEPKARWAQQDLSESNIFFVPDPGSADGLSRLLHVPEALADQLSIVALRQAAESLENELERLQRNDTREPNALDDMRRVMEELEELRRRARRKIDTASAELRRGMETSVLRLRQDLLHGLDGALRGGTSTELHQADLRQRFQTLLSTAVDRWTRSAQAQVANGLEDIATDVLDGVTYVDWTTVNHAAETIGRSGDYPDALVKALTNRETAHELRPIPAVAGRNDEPLPVLTMLGAGGVAIALWALAGPIPAVLGSLLLGAGGWAIYKEHGVRRYTEHARSVIVAVTEQILAQVDDVVNDCVQQLRRQMKDELQKAEELLGEGASHFERSSGPAIPQSAELSAVRALRRRLDEMSEGDDHGH